MASVREWPAPVRDAPEPALDRLPAFDATGLAAAVGGQLLSDSPRPIRGGAVDSRRVHPGNVFFALPGERTDGHRYLRQATDAGAAALVVSQPQAPELGRLLATSTDVSSRPATIAVRDSLAALQAAAAAWRARFDPVVVGVTGSLAKTSTKEQIAEVLAERWTVLRNTANENNEIGLPLTLLRLLPDHEVAVLEMGMYVPGDIAQLATLARPRVGVVTAVRGTHLSRAGSIEAIERGKRELVEALPEGGTAVLNADDPRVAAMAAHLPAGVRLLSYGFAAGAEVSASGVESRGERGMHFALRIGSEQVPVGSPALGRHGTHNALAAAAVGHTLGMDLQQIARGLARSFSAPHRSVLFDLGRWRILDDTYNAAPDSMFAALDLLASLAGRRIAVLGEMLELGDASVDAHRAVGRHAAACAELLVCVGAAATNYGQGARQGGLPAGAIHQVPDRDACLELLVGVLREGDVVLLKASRGVELDLLVDKLRAVAGEGSAA